MPQAAAPRNTRYELGRHRKLLNAAQFRTVFNRRVSVHGKHFSFHAVATNLEDSRVGITVSKKVSKRAVQRNRIKRQIRESFRHNRHNLSAMDIVVVSKPGGAEQENTLLRTELDNLWGKVNRKCEKSQQNC